MKTYEEALVRAVHFRRVLDLMGDEYGRKTRFTECVCTIADVFGKNPYDVMFDVLVILKNERKAA